LLVKSVTDLEIDEAIRDAWGIVQGGSASASPSARRLAAALLAVTGGTPTHPHWVTPDDLWRDRLVILAEQNAWLAAWGPGPGEPDCRVPLPCCRKAGPGARTLICCGARPCGSAPMLKARAEQCASGNRGAGMTPNNPVLPAQGRGGADYPCPNPMTCD